MRTYNKDLLPITQCVAYMFNLQCEMCNQLAMQKINIFKMCYKRSIFIIFGGALTFSYLIKRAVRITKLYIILITLYNKSFCALSLFYKSTSIALTHEGNIIVILRTTILNLIFIYRKAI